MAVINEHKTAILFGGVVEYEKQITWSAIIVAGERVQRYHFGQLVAIFANGFFGLIHNAVQTIASFDLFHSATIIFGV